MVRRCGLEFFWIKGFSIKFLLSVETALGSYHEKTCILCGRCFPVRIAYCAISGFVVVIRDTSVIVYMKFLDQPLKLHAYMLKLHFLHSRFDGLWCRFPWTSRVFLSFLFSKHSFVYLRKHWEPRLWIEYSLKLFLSIFNLLNVR